MFKDLKFWNSWPAIQRISFISLSIILALSFCYLIIAYYSGGSFVLDWEKVVEIKPIRVVYDSFKSGLYEFLIYADNYVLNQSFKSGELIVNEPIAYIYFFVFVLGLIFLLAISTTLSRFYFYLSAGFFLLILLTFKFENLLVFGLFGKEVLVGVFLLYTLTAYYFNAFRTETPLQYRFLTLLGITIIIGIIIYFFSESGTPIYYLASYGIISSMIMSVVFILLLGFEIVKGILLITTKSSGGDGRNNFTHFTIITVVYLALLILMFLYDEDYISWKLIFINPVWILVIATVLGIWGFRNKEVIFESIIPYHPYGAYAYLTGAIICFTSVAFFMASANDPYMDIIDDAVIFSQMSFTILFYVYIIANFFPAMMEGMKVYKILYKPKFMPLVSARIAGLIGVLGFVILVKMLPYYQTYAGYYISIAKLHMVRNENIAAQEYFNLANIYGKQTHLGNLALSKMAEKQEDLPNKSNYLAKSINQNPTEYAYADLAALFSQQDRYFDALFTLRNGLRDFPESGPLANNLGLLLANSDVLDSAAMYLDKASEKRISQKPAEANLISIFALNNLRISKDSLQLLIDKKKDNIAYLNNVLATAQQQEISNLKIPVNPYFSKNADRDQLSYNFNYILYQYQELDSSLWKEFRGFYAGRENVGFQQNLEYAFGMGFAKKGYSIPSFRIFNVLNQSDIYGYSRYDIMLAQLYLKYDAPHSALEHFDATVGYYQNDILLQKAFALMEAGRLEEAKEFWQRIMQMEEESFIQLAEEMIQLLDYESFRQVLNTTDQEKYNFLRYRDRELSFDEHEGLILSMSNDDYKDLAYLDLAKRMYAENNYSDALDLLDEINLSTKSDQHFIKNVLSLKAQLLAETDDFEKINSFLSSIEPYKMELPSQYLLLNAIVSKWNNEPEKAERQFSELSDINAFCETCITKSADYFIEQNEDKRRAYEMLLAAITINKYSYKLNKAYAKISIELGLDSYAEDILVKMKKVLTPEKHQELADFVEETIEENEVEW